MADKTPIPNRDKIVLEYLSGGVTYRQLEAKYGIDHALIHYWVMHHKGKVRNRPSERKSDQNTNPIPPPLPPPPPLLPPVDAEKAQLTKQLREAHLTIALLQEVISIAQAEQGLVIPKKFTTAPAARQAVKTVGQKQPVSVGSLCPLLGISRQSFYAFFRS